MGLRIAGGKRKITGLDIAMMLAVAIVTTGALLILARVRDDTEQVPAPVEKVVIEDDNDQIIAPGLHEDIPVVFGDKAYECDLNVDHEDQITSIACEERTIGL